MDERCSGEIFTQHASTLCGIRCLDVEMQTQEPEAVSKDKQPQDIKEILL